MEIRTLTYGVSVNRKFTIAGSLAASEPIVFNSTPSPVRDVFGRFELDWLPPVSVRNKTLQGSRQLLVALAVSGADGNSEARWGEELTRRCLRPTQFRSPLRARTL